VGSFGFDGLFDTVFEAVGYIYQRHLVFIGMFVKTFLSLCRSSMDLFR